LTFINIFPTAGFHLCGMKITSQQLLDDLAGLTKQHVSFVQKLQALPDELLTQKAQPASWNALECIEHLNRYGNFYLPEIRKRIAESTTHTAPVFKSGWLGNYFANSMLPKDKLNKMRTFAVMNPANSTLDREVIQTFARQLQTMLELLRLAAKTDLNKVRTSISISSLIRLKLGDTLRVVIYHNERHIRQAERAIHLKQ